MTFIDPLGLTVGNTLAGVGADEGSHVGESDSGAECKVTGERVVVRGKEHTAINGRRQVLQNRVSDSIAVKGGCAPAQLIEHHHRIRRRILQAHWEGFQDGDRKELSTGLSVGYLHIQTGLQASGWLFPCMAL